MKNLISLDSLTDIVSNSVGILIIFAVINLIHDNNKTYQLEIPIEHKTELKPSFFMIKNDRILAMDTNTLFSNATLQATRGSATSERLFSLEYYDVLGKITESKKVMGPRRKHTPRRTVNSCSSKTKSRPRKP